MTAVTASAAALASMPVSKLLAVTPSDTVALSAGVCRALWIGVGGNVAILAEDDTVAVTLLGAATGQVIPVRAQRVNLTNTTATNIVALY